jgi:hypothetical protein
MKATCCLIQLFSMLLLLSGSADGESSAPTPRSPSGVNQITISDVNDFLAQRVCVRNGIAVSLSPLDPMCESRPQRASDPLYFRRGDLGNPNPPGYFQLSDSFVTDDGSAWGATWSYAPWGPRVIQNGDGGEIYVFDGTTVRIEMTMDGGVPGAMHYFVGPKCGGTGWVAFKNDAPTGSWAESLGGIAISDNDPNACPTLGSNYTRYRLETLSWTIETDDGPQMITAPTIISEVYAAGPPGLSQEMERTFWVKRWGRIAWEPWAINREPVIDIATRCPDSPWPTPGPRWVRYNCRFNTRLIQTDGSLSATSYGWPPPGFTR